MQITKELFKGKVLSDGTYPVMIRIYHNGLVRRVATSVGARERNWDKRKGRLSCRECDYRLKNDHIESVYRRVAGSIQNYIDSNLKPRSIPFYLISRKIPAPRLQKPPDADTIYLSNPIPKRNAVASSS